MPAVLQSNVFEQRILIFIRIWIPHIIVFRKHSDTQTVEGKTRSRQYRYSLSMMSVYHIPPPFFNLFFGLWFVLKEVNLFRESSPKASHAAGIGLTSGIRSSLFLPHVPRVGKDFSSWCSGNIWQLSSATVLLNDVTRTDLWVI